MIVGNAYEFLYLTSRRRQISVLWERIKSRVRTLYILFIGKVLGNLISIPIIIIYAWSYILKCELDIYISNQKFDERREYYCPFTLNSIEKVVNVYTFSLKWI